MKHRSRRHSSPGSVVALLAIGSVLLPTVVEAGAEPAPCGVPVLTLEEAAALLRVASTDLADLAGSGGVPARRIGEAWRFSCPALMAWLAGDTAPLAAMSVSEPGSGTASRSPARPPLDAGELAGIVAAGTAGPAGDGEAHAEAEEESIGEAPENPTAEDVFLRRQRVLLAPGDLTFDIGAFYSQGNSEFVTVVDDAIVLATLEQETAFSALQLRLGIANETELFAGTSYVSQDSTAYFGDRKLGSSDDSDFGDVRVGLRRTLLREGRGRPNIIASLDGYVPTGNTQYAAGFGLSFVKSIDPVALFASVGYRHTFNEEYDDITQLQPEQRIDAAFGYALALNDTLSINTSIAASFLAATEFPEFPGVELRRQDSYAVQFGLTSWLARGLYIEPTLSFQLDGPDSGFAFGLTLFRFPY